MLMFYSDHRFTLCVDVVQLILKMLVVYVSDNMNGC